MSKKTRDEWVVHLLPEDHEVEGDIDSDFLESIGYGIHHRVKDGDVLQRVGNELRRVARTEGRTLVVRIDLDNAAFEDYAPGEVARILDSLGDALQISGMPSGNVAYPLRDINGNHVGEARVQGGAS